MKNTFESFEEVNKQAEFKAEFSRISALFEKSDDTVKALASGLIQDAAYLYAENKVLRSILNQTGMVRVNPNNNAQQRPVEAAKQYRANCDTYSSIMGRLFRMLDTQNDDEEDDMGEYEDS